MNSAPIGVFDSGSGGLSVWPAIHELLPRESLAYFGDHVNIPYGNKPAGFIRQRVVKAIEFLTSKKCKLVVIACNTATIAGIDYYRKKFPAIPIIGVVPVIKTAASRSITKHFVVLSTDFTAESQYQRELIAAWAKGCSVVSLGSSTLVPLIEEGVTDGAQVNEELHRIFDPIENTPYDIIAIGCTHYPFIRKAIRNVAGDKAQIVDSSEAVARQVLRILSARHDLSEGPPGETFFTTGDAEKVGAVFYHLLHRREPITHVTV